MTDATLPAAVSAEPAPETVTGSAPAERISFEDYLARYNSVEGVRTEWTPNGVEVYRVSNNLDHQELLALLYLLFRTFLDVRKLGRVILAGMPMRVGEDKPAREPDLLIILNENLNRLQPTYLDGAADAVVEVVSPESDERDRGTKFIEYEAAGVKEYYLFDPIRRESYLYRLGADAHYHRVEVNAEGQLASTVLPGFVFDPNLLWRDPLPGTLDIVALVQTMVQAAGQ